MPNCSRVPETRSPNPGQTDSRLSFPAVEDSSKTVGAHNYSISATAPSGSKLNSQTIRFALKKSDSGSQTWGFFLISTGKSKTQAQIEQLLSQAFHKFPGAAPG